MQALGALSPIESARANLQEKIADFLAGRARLSRLMSNPNLQISGQANGLYAVQLQLENQLQNDITPRLQAIQGGAWTFSDIAQLFSFTSSVIGQINNVNKLDARVGGFAISTPFFGWQTLMIGGVGLVVLGLVSGTLLGKK